MRERQLLRDVAPTLLLHARPHLRHSVEQPREIADHRKPDPAK